MLESFKESLLQALREVEKLPEQQVEPSLLKGQEFKRSLVKAIDEIDGGPGPGINITSFYRDVRRFIYHQFTRTLRLWGLDPEDAIQEVYLGLLIRNQGICPWRPTGGRSQSGYVYMVTEGVVLNMIQRQKYRSQFQVSTIMACHRPTGVGLFDDTLLQDSITPQDLHRFIVEQQVAPAEVDMVLVDDLDKKCRPLHGAHLYVKHILNGGQRQDLYGIIPGLAIVEARKVMREFLLS